jgi:hypothetical protein
MRAFPRLLLSTIMRFLVAILLTTSIGLAFTQTTSAGDRRSGSAYIGNTKSYGKRYSGPRNYHAGSQFKRKFSHRRFRKHHAMDYPGFRLKRTAGHGFHSYKPYGRYAGKRHQYRYLRNSPGIYRLGDSRHVGFERRQAGGALLIAINSAVAAPTADPEAESRTTSKNECTPGEYCVIRLGYGPSAPKIITLNTSEITIDQNLLGSDKTPK